MATAQPEPMNADNGARALGAAGHTGTDPEAEIPKAYALTKANARAVRKRGGALRWAQKQCCLLEGFIEASLQGHTDDACLSEFTEHQTEISGWDVAAEVWDVVVALEDDTKLCLKERHQDCV